MKTIRYLFLLCITMLSASCAHEFAVVDYSFEFAADITYDSQADEHRQT